MNFNRENYLLTMQLNKRLSAVPHFLKFEEKKSNFTLLGKLDLFLLDRILKHLYNMDSSHVLTLKPHRASHE